MIKPTSKLNQAPQTAAARAAIAVPTTEVEYDTTNAAWVKFDVSMTRQLVALEQEHPGLATPLSLAKKLENSRR